MCPQLPPASPLPTGSPKSRILGHRDRKGDPLYGIQKIRRAGAENFTTERSNNGGTEAINSIIELHRRLARGYRSHTNYRLCILLVAGEFKT